MFTFNQPLWILFGATSCMISWFLWSRFEGIRLQQLSRFAASSLLPKLTGNVSAGRRTLKKTLLLFAVFLCFVALARPQYGYRWIDVKHKGIDILFALDTSKSMLAEDIRPNRLTRSKLAILDFVSTLSGDRVGLLPFAGSSYLMCPLTSDYQAFEQSLMAVDQATIPQGGTDIGAAILSAQKILHNEANHKILILITDGEQLHGDVMKAAQKAAENKMTIYTVGVGTDEGELIPDPKKGGFVQSDNGSYVKSKLDRENLQRVADTADGLYVPLGDQGQGLATIYREKLALVPKTELSERRKQVPIERFSWPLGLAVILLSIEFLLSGRKTKRPIPGGVNRLTRALKSTTPLLCLTGLALLASVPDVYAFNDQEPQENYNNKEYLKASEQYQSLLEKDPQNPELNFNNGTTSYQNNLFAEAVQSFDKALTSDDLYLQEKSYYNKANSLYRLGESTVGAEPERTVSSWEQALASYQSALSLNPENPQAAANHEFVSQRLKQLQQELEQKNNQDQDSDENQSSDEQNQKEKDQEQPPHENDDSEQDKNEAKDQQQKPSEKNSSTKPDENGNKQPERDDAQEPASIDQEQDAQNTQPGSNQAELTEQEAQQMNKEEAEQLLQALQAEEGRIDFYAPIIKNNEQSQDW